MSTLTVGTGQQYTTIAAAIGASQDGDVINVMAGTYTNDFATIFHKITLQGVGGMVNLVATASPPNGKAILTTDNDVTIDHFAFSGTAVPDGNGAGIRYESGNLVIRNSLFAHNQNGILGGANATGTILIQNSEFNQNGSGTGFTHNLYVGAIASLVVGNSYFHDAVVGHEIKSRALSNTITGNRIQDNATGSASYSIDLPDGNVGVIRNNVIEKGPLSQNRTVIHYGGENAARAGASLEISGNTILSDQAGTTLLANSTSAANGGTAVTALISGNSTYNIATINNGAATVTNETVLTTRPTLDTTPVATAPSGGTVPVVVTPPVGVTPPVVVTSPVVVPPPVVVIPPVVMPPVVVLPAPVVVSPAPVTAPAAGLVLNLSEDAYQGDAQYTVAIDGQQVGATRTATVLHASGQSEHVALGALSAGPHQVAVTFLNDKYDGTAATDRNLYVTGASYNGQSVSGSAATLMSAGTASFGVTVPGGAPVTSTAVVNVSEDAYQGDAQFTITVDGKQQGGTYTATALHGAGQTQAITVAGIPEGFTPHDIAVTFLNDKYDGTPSTDRNLYVNSIQFDGKSVPGSTASLLSAGTQHFTAVAPANWTG